MEEFILADASGRAPVNSTRPVRPFRCKCGTVLGYTDGATLRIGEMRFDRPVYPVHSLCGQRADWHPDGPKR